MTFSKFSLLTLSFLSLSARANDQFLGGNPAIIDGDTQGAAAEVFNMAAQVYEKSGRAPKQWTVNGGDIQVDYDMGSFVAESYLMQVDPTATYQVIFKNDSDVIGFKDSTGHYGLVTVTGQANTDMTQLLIQSGAEQKEAVSGHPEMGSSYVGKTPGFSCSEQACVFTVDGL